MPTGQCPASLLKRGQIIFRKPLKQHPIWSHTFLIEGGNVEGNFRKQALPVIQRQHEELRTHIIDLAIPYRLITKNNFLKLIIGLLSFSVGNCCCVFFVNLSRLVPSAVLKQIAKSIASKICLNTLHCTHG